MTENFRKLENFSRKSTWRSRVSNTVNHVHQAKFRVLMAFLAGNDYWATEYFLNKKTLRDFCDFYVNSVSFRNFFEILTFCLSGTHQKVKKT